MSWYTRYRKRRTLALRRVWRFVCYHVGHRGAVLAFLVMLDLLYGYSMNTEPGYLAWVDLGLSIHTWSLIWIAVGVILLTGISAKRDKFHYTIAVMLKVFWSAVFFRTWLTGGYDRGWVVGLIWGGFAALLFIISSWPECFVHKEPLEKREDGEE